MKSEPTSERQGNGRHRDGHRRHLHEAGVAHRAVQRWRIQPLEPAHDPHVLVGIRARRAKQDRRGNRNQRQREQQRRRQRGDDGRRQWAVHAAFDPGHREERDEHRDDDQRGEEDRATDLLRRVQRHVAPRHAGLLLQVMHDVFCDDDGRVDQQADRDGQAAKRHRVDADAAGAQQQSGQRDRQRKRERHQQRGAPVAQQHEQHDDDEAGADQDGAAHAAKRAARRDRTGRRPSAA